MEKIDFKKVFKTVKQFADAHSPEIFAATAITFGTAAVIEAVKGTVKAVRKADEAECLKGDKLTKKELVKTCWKCYIPTVLCGTISAGSVVAGTAEGSKRNAALMAAYKASETAFVEYKEEVTGILGEKKAKIVDHDIMDRKVRNTNVPDDVANSLKEEDPKKTVIVTGGESQLCYDALSGRYFKSDKNSIDAALNEINYQLNYNDYCSENDWFDAIGLEGTENGYALGWNNVKGQLSLDYDSCITPDGRPALVIKLSRAPEYKYDYVG